MFSELPVCLIKILHIGIITFDGRRYTTNNNDLILFIPVIEGHLNGLFSLLLNFLCFSGYTNNTKSFWFCHMFVFYCVIFQQQQYRKTSSLF